VTHAATHRSSGSHPQDGAGDRRTPERLPRVKHHHLARRAASRLPDLSADIVGAGARIATARDSSTAGACCRRASGHFRRGKRYGTLLIDLERQCRVDVLPDRTADSLAHWLQVHPGVEIISRDRGGAYAEGARQGTHYEPYLRERWSAGCQNAQQLWARDPRARLRWLSLPGAAHALPDGGPNPANQAGRAGGWNR